MKFTVAWNEVLSQNNTLKGVLIALTVSTLILCVTTVRLAVREPLVVERSCLSRALTPVKTAQTAEEIEHFIREEIATRFDSDILDAKVFLGEEEYAYRLKEQDELKKKGMNQKIYPTLIKATNKDVQVEADRILTVGTLRSNVPFSLSVQVSATSRSEANPYGLIIQRVSQVTKESK